MDTVQELFTIQEAAEQTNLTVHTLRYYERIGLVMPVGRAANGHRRYSQRDIGFIQGLNCWLLTGMPLEEIQRYVKLYMEGDSTVAERREILAAHREKVVRQLEAQQIALQYIDMKIAYYAEIEHKQEKEQV
jgi:DNA-binding transcriptional MerR regulator